MSKYYTEITAQHDWYDLKLKEVWRYKDLIWLFTKRDFTVSYKQTILGPAWLIINPLMSSLIYCFIFGGIAQMGTDGIPQMLFYLTGNAIWTFFAACVTNNAQTFTRNAYVFGKVYFPRLTISVSYMLSAIIRFLIQLAIIFVFLVVYIAKDAVHPIYPAWILIPFVLLHLGLMGMGVGIIISSMTTKYRDLSILVGFGISLWMYITPVVYPLSQATNHWIRMALFANPVTTPVEALRLALLGKGTVEPVCLIWSIFFTIAVTVSGIVIFNKVEKTFMDTV